MWKCHKCGKPVYFAERKQSLGYDWHPECLRCEECSRRLNPGQHAEHKGVPYCHVPCYGALFGPQLFGHGTRVESHSSFGRVGDRSAAAGGGPNTPRSHLESKLKLFNQFCDGSSGEIRSREVNGRLVLEGALRIHWGVIGLIHLKEDDDQRTVVTVRKRNSYRSEVFSDGDCDASDGASAVDSGVLTDLSLDDTTSTTSTISADPDNVVPGVVPGEASGQKSGEASGQRSATLPHRLEARKGDWDELDDLLQVERVVDDTDKLYQTMPTGLPSVMIHAGPAHPPAQPPTDANLNPAADWSSGNSANSANSTNSANGNVDEVFPPADPDSDDSVIEYDDNSDPGPGGGGGGVVIRRAPKTGSTAIRRRPGKRRSRTALKRRCSINGHFYDRDTSFFTPPRGSTMSVHVSSLVSSQEVINLLLDKYKVDSRPNNFALFVVRDNGEQRRLREDEYPLLVRVMLGPHEDVAKLYIMDSRGTEEISSEVAQFLNLSSTECRSILDRYRLEEDREAKRVRAKFREMRKRIKQRMEDLKVRL